MTPGLYQRIENLLTRRRQQEATAGNPGAEPQVRHLAGVYAATASKQMQESMEAAMENRVLISKIQDLIDHLGSSPHTSRHRSLVITKLEEAQDRLLRELGPQEEMGDRGSEMGDEEI